MEDQDETKVTKLCYSCSVIISLSHSNGCNIMAKEDSCHVAKINMYIQVASVKVGTGCS